ncbi:beta-lactamase class A/beta-lactamase class A CARB-5 [Marinobacter persicus]|uniref:Beta-lactamase n=3 Tax=Marinobacteraceae TaxID=2887365 RepID=A0A1I3SAM0_9GAMM|nr:MULTISPECIES: class A beta-lactamase [Marinobacter]MBK1852846.1 class A beta-lactamase [Marinobacter sp. 1-4A]SFJ55778.1 beta-lactamase class A/beta-lactamase class A CARB-5 [Marinobacter persicus]
MKTVLNFFVVFFIAIFPSIAPADDDNSLIKTVERIADELGARVGFSAYDVESDQHWEYHADQRFAMSSTFKTLACAALLQRVDAGQENLDRKVSFSESDLVTYSPVTEKYAGGQALTLSDLCEAALTMSDNTAANLILRVLGGPAQVTSFARGLGDGVTRLDRWETELNEAAPSDQRDTTTPNAMVKNLQSLLLGDALSVKSRDQLRDWLERNQVADGLFRAVVPEGWIVADRTGAGGFGSRSITAIIWPPERQPIIVALYLTETEASFSKRNDAIAEIGKALILTVNFGR